MGIVRVRTWQEDGPTPVRLQASHKIREVTVDAGQHYQDVFSLKNTMPPHPTHGGYGSKQACCSSCASGGQCEDTCRPTVTRISVPETVTCTRQKEMLCHPVAYQQPMCAQPMPPPPQPICAAPPVMCQAPQPICAAPPVMCQAPPPPPCPAPQPMCVSPCQPAFSSAQTCKEKGVNDHFFMNVMATIFCCLCFGAVGIMRSLEAQDAIKKGDKGTAHDASRRAKRWCYIATGIGVIFYMIALIMALLFLTGVIKFPVTWATG